VHVVLKVSWFVIVTVVFNVSWVMIIIMHSLFIEGYPVRQIPKAKTELFKKTCTYSGPKLWNELPFSIRQASSHNAFKTKVKSLILNASTGFYFLNI
jgi:hypothetical protein